MKARRFSVSGLDETGMIDAFRKSIRNYDGINSIKVDIIGESVTVDYDDKLYTHNDIRKMVNDIGLVVTDSVEAASSHWLIP